MMMQEIITTPMPEKYIIGAIHHAPPIKNPAISAITGSLAPHGIHVVVIIVMRRSFSFSIVLLAMIPGTPQPDDIRKGIKLLPESPKRLNILSMIKATRAI